ncbi:MAG TPA: hypothetical protein PKD52_06545 [Clostridiales bacterium]|nr:hypothetical protein [Clostridiales bacterium]
MKKFMVFLAAVLFCLTVLTACGDGNLTKNYTTLAEDFTTTLYENDYDGALAYVDGAMQESITTDALKEIAEGTTSEYGAFQEVVAAEEISMSDYLQQLGISDDEATALDSLNCTVVVVTVGFTSSEMYLYLVFDTADRELVGINVYGAEGKGNTETALTEDKLRTAARSFLQAAFSGDFDTAYDLMSETLQGEMDAAAFNTLVQETASLYGEFGEIGQILVDGDEVIAYVSFAEGEINAYLTFDSNGLVDSFFTDTPH